MTIEMAETGRQQLPNGLTRFGDLPARPQNEHAPQEALRFSGRIEEVIVVTDEGKERDCNYAEELHDKSGMPVVVVGAGEFLLRANQRDFREELAKGVIVFDKSPLFTDEPGSTNGFSASSMAANVLGESYVQRSVPGVPNFTRQGGSEDVMTMIRATAASREYKLANAV